MNRLLKLAKITLPFLTLVVVFAAVGNKPALAFNSSKHCYDAITSVEGSCNSASGNRLEFQITGPQTDVVGANTYTLACRNSKMTSTSGEWDGPSNWDLGNCFFSGVYYPVSPGSYDVTASTEVCYLDGGDNCVDKDTGLPSFGSLTVNPVAGATATPNGGSSFNYGISLSPDNGPGVNNITVNLSTDDPGYSSATIYYDGTYFCNIGSSKSGPCTTLGGTQGGHTVRADFAFGGSASTTYTASDGAPAPTASPPVCGCGSFLSCNNNGVPGDGLNPACTNPTTQCYGGCTNSAPTEKTITVERNPEPVQAGGNVTFDATTSFSPDQTHVAIYYAANNNAYGQPADVECWWNTTGPFGSSQSGTTALHVICPTNANTPSGTYRWSFYSSFQAPSNPFWYEGSAYGTGTIVQPLTQCDDPSGATIYISPSTGPIGTQVSFLNVPGSYTLNDVYWSPHNDPVWKLFNYAGYVDRSTNPPTWIVNAGNWNWNSLGIHDINVYTGSNYMSCPFNLIADPPTAFNFSASTSSQCNGATSANHIVWTASTGADWYVIYRSGTYVGQVYAPQTFFDDGGLPPGAAYDYSVLAVNGTGTVFATDPSTGNPDLNVSTATCDTTPPSNISITILPSGACWSPDNWNGQIGGIATDDSGGSGIGRVDLYVYQLPAYNQVQDIPVINPPSNWTAQVNTGALSYGSQYTFKAKATDNAGNSLTTPDYVPFGGFIWNTSAAACADPFLNTTNGDVHSNTKIDTTGGQ